MAGLLFSARCQSPWTEIPESERADILKRYTEIRTNDGGANKFIDGGIWIMLEFGYANDQGKAWQATSKPLKPFEIAHANDVLRRSQSAYEVKAH